MAALSRDDVLSGCDDAQRDAITSPAAPLLVVAGAGSGKTRVLTRRIAWRVVADEIRPERALALTFTRKAAHELRSRLSALGLSSPVPAGTFHSVALAELRRRAIDLGRPLPVVVDSKHRLLDRVAPKNAGDRRSRRNQLNRFASEIEWAKARRITPDHYVDNAREEGRRPQITLCDVAEVYAAYEDEKRRRVVLDLDDLLARLTEELSFDPDFAAASRYRFQHLFVDELQDANPAQLALLDAWLGDRPDLFAVGDARQAIYGWNGAEAEAMTTFARSHPGTTILTLAANYRSTSAIVSIASSVLGDTGAIAMRAESGPHPSLTRYTDETEESASVAREIALARSGGRDWSECAVLARTNFQLTAISDACTSLGVPVRSASAIPFLDSPAVSRLLRPIERSSEPGRFTEWTEGLRRRAIGGSDQGEGTTTPPSEGDDESLLLAFAIEFATLEPAPTGVGFVAYLRETADPSGTRGRTSGVDLLTFHRAKGLEWESVWVIGLEDGYVPLAHALNEAQRDEERRLLYVALTRARESLHCSWSERRQMNGRTINRSRSPFLEPVSRALGALPTSTNEPQRTARLGLEASRAALSRRRGG